MGRMNAAPDLAFISTGGNSMRDDATPKRALFDERRINGTVDHMARVARKGTMIVAGHGNGPQVGELLQRYIDHGEDPRSLAWLTYISQDKIGRALRRRFREVTGGTMAINYTRVGVDKENLGEPVKGIGNYEYGRERFDAEGIKPIQDPARPDYWRRGVVSPKPERIHPVDLDEIVRLIDSRLHTIACGGGGIPWELPEGAGHREPGQILDLDAVVDKDAAMARLIIELLAKDIAGDVYFTVTDVPGYFPSKDELVKYRAGQDAELIRKLSVAQVEEIVASTSNDGGMMPKISAAASAKKANPDMKVYITDIDGMQRVFAGDESAATEIVA